jgi:hypothetical protein
MPVFRVRGTTRHGEPLSVRFEVPDEGNLQTWLATEQARAESVRRLPLTSWPFSRLPWMILVFPVLCYGLYLSGVQAVWSGLDLWREPATRRTYERLDRDGVTVSGAVTAERVVSLRGSRRRTLEYAFVAPGGSRQRGVLASLPGDVGVSRHDLRLAAAAPPVPGDELTVTVLPHTPAVHAPFPVDDRLFERFDELGLEVRRRLGFLAVLAPVFAWMVWNVLIRTGNHYVLSASGSRLVLITRGENPFGELDEEDDEEEG